MDKPVKLLKELLRRMLFGYPFPGEFEAKEGTLKFRFLNWLYEDGEQSTWEE